MTIPELICAILLIISAGILIINIVIKVMQKKRLTDIDKALLLIVPGVIFLFVIVLAYRYSDEIKLAEFLQILLMFGLVTVTIVYAWSASRQASASRKMAEEMREQRYDAVRPVIDFELQDPGISADAQRMVAHRCLIHNIGVGPAIDLNMPILLNLMGDSAWQALGTIGRDGKAAARFVLATKRAENHWFLVAHYRDIYDRCFESSREVVSEGPEWKLDRLKTCKITEQEFGK